MDGHVAFDRPPRERYVRTSLEIDGYTYEPAVEYRDGDDFDRITADLEEMTSHMVFLMPRGRSTMERATFLGDKIRNAWSDRAYFVEAWQNGMKGWVQIYQPHGVPRNQTR